MLTPNIDKTTGNINDAGYSRFLADFEQDVLGSADTGPLFTTDAEGLWDAYLQSFPEGERQGHNCSACRRFIHRYGGLVRIGADGETTSALWESEAKSHEYEPGFRALRSIVKRAKVTGVFLTKRPELGHSITGVWRHFSLRTPAACCAESAVLTPFQQIAEKRQDHGNVLRALVEFPAGAVDQALTLLRSEALYRSEKVLGQAEWLHALHVAWDAAKGDRRANVVWRAVATATAGFCHPRASMIGTLLEDIVAGLDFAEVSRKFAQKMRPDLYQRPQAAPTSGAIAAAEKLVEQLGLAPAFERRFARLAEAETLWKPADQGTPARKGVFGHVKPKGAEPSSNFVTSAQAITWTKFARTVLPGAKRIEFMVPPHGGFGALLTAVHPDALPLLQWDSLARRNPFSHYVYVNGSPCSQWGLSPGWCEVTAIALNPAQWFGAKHPHQGESAMLFLRGALDQREDQGNAIFPETVRAELHGVRAVIEAYSKRATISGRSDASACGYVVSARNPGTVRVHQSNGVKLDYQIDRWE